MAWTGARSLPCGACWLWVWTFPRTPCQQMPLSSPPGSGDRVAIWHGGGPEAAGSQCWLQEADHSGPSPRSAVWRHGQHPGRAVGQSHGAGPSWDARPAAGKKTWVAAFRVSGEIILTGRKSLSWKKLRLGSVTLDCFWRAYQQLRAKWVEIMSQAVSGRWVIAFIETHSIICLQGLLDSMKESPPPAPHTVDYSWCTLHRISLAILLLRTIIVWGRMGMGQKSSPSFSEY